jgi:hypothetical protein
MNFGHQAAGDNTTITFFDNAPNRANGAMDTSLRTSISGPFVVPEPGTLALIGLGLIGLCLTPRRRRANGA